MNGEQKQLFNKIEAFAFDKSGVNYTFSQRLATENDWSIEYTKGVIQEYRKFVFLAVVAKHIVTPSEQIDRVWHLHLTYTHSYWNEFCPNILGQSLHHQPSEGGNSEQIKYHNLYRQTFASYIKFFGEQPPEDIWSSPEKRFGKDLSFKRVNIKEHWIVPKPNLSFNISSSIDKINFIIKKKATVIISIFLGLSILFGAALPGLADHAPFYWDFLNVTLDIQDNGDLLVTEKQKYVFTDIHSPEHYRFIKLDNVKAIKDVRVFEDNHPLPIETATKGDRFWIKWQEYLDNVDTHTFTLQYRAIGATKNSYGADLLNWKAIFPKRDAAINNSEIVINLPESLAGKVRNYYIIGGDFQSSLIDDRTIKFDSLRSLLPGESSIIKISFLGNFLNLEPTEQSSSNNNLSFLMVVIGLMSLLGFIQFITLISFNTVSDRPKTKSQSRSNSSFGGCGGCGGGCGGGG